MSIISCAASSPDTNLARISPPTPDESWMHKGLSCCLETARKKLFADASNAGRNGAELSRRNALGQLDISEFTERKRFSVTYLKSDLHGKAIY